jgi:general secretion pathway protein I
MHNEKQHKRSRAAGFTLIEVMLAMAVFAIAGVALLGVADTSTRSLGQLEQKILANWVASNQLVETRLEQKWPPKNNKKGSVELAGHLWHWQQKVIKTTDKQMRALVMEVRLDEKQEQAVASLTTYVASPK